MKLNRRVWFINPRFQFKLIGYFSFVMLINFLLVKLFALMAFDSFYKMCKEAGLDPEGKIVQFINMQQGLLEDYISASFFFTLLFTIIGGYVISHRVAGPIWRINKVVKDSIKSGDFKTVHIRKNDYFHDLKETINDLFHLIKNKK